MGNGGSNGGQVHDLIGFGGAADAQSDAAGAAARTHVATGVGGLLQGVQDLQGLRQQLHFQDSHLPPAARMRLPGVMS